MKPAFQRNFIDNALTRAVALPAAASTTVTTAVLDIGENRNTDRDVAAGSQVGLEIAYKVPALSTTIVPDTRTYVHSIEMSDDAAFGTYETLRSITMTGAGGAGVAAVDLRAGIPSDAKRYFRGKSVSGASTTTAAAVVAELCMVF